MGFIFAMWITATIVLIANVMVGRSEAAYLRKRIEYYRERSDRFSEEVAAVRMKNIRIAAMLTADDCDASARKADHLVEEIIDRIENDEIID